jgi:hypothetical protein
MAFDLACLYAQKTNPTNILVIPALSGILVTDSMVILLLDKTYTTIPHRNSALKITLPHSGLGIVLLVSATLRTCPC